MKHRFSIVALTITSLILSASICLADAPIVVESKCSSGGSYVEGGTGWGNSSSKSNKTSCSSGSRSTKNAGGYADFIPPITTEGSYDVFITWGSATSSNNGANAEGAQISIIDKNGTQSFAVNMRGHANCSGANNDQLIYVGRGYFVPGQGHKLRLSHTATGQCYNGASKRYVDADAVVFQFVAPLPTLPQTWGGIKTLYRD